MHYRLVCSDVDGTLVDKQGRIPPRNAAAIREYQKAGGTFALCSGRVFASASMLAMYYDIPCYVVCCNGALLGHAQTGEILYAKTLAPEMLSAIYAVCDRYCAIVGLNFRDGVVYTGKDGIENEFYEYGTRKYTPKTGISMTVDYGKDYRAAGEGREIFKISAWAKDEASFSAMEKAFLKIPGTSTTRTNLKWHCEVTADTDKWDGILRLKEALQIDISEIVCIGDSMNDYKMIQNAGLGVAMKNADPPVLAAADFVTADCASCGVAVLLEKLLKESRER